MANPVPLAVLACILGVVVYYLRIYMVGEMCLSDARIDGHVVVITGGNTGIGRETALDLASRGGKIYLAVRSLEKGRAAATYIRKESGVPSNRVIVMKLDLASFQSVRDFVKEFKKREKRLDILINNAGVLAATYNKTVDGNELSVTVNHLSPFLLTNLLLDTLKKSVPSRVLIVSSVVHGYGTIHFPDLSRRSSFNGVAAYFQAKLANVLFGRELAKRLHETGVTVYTLHPGNVRTELHRHLFLDWPGVKEVYELFTWPFYKNSTEGAQTTVCCAVDPELESESGKYYSNVEETEPSLSAQDDKAAKRLWEITAQLVGMET